MIEDFVNKHRPLVVILFILIIIIMVVGIIVKSVDNNNSATKTTEVGIDTKQESQFNGYSNFLYTISAPVNNTIKIDSFSGYRNAAVNQLYNAGFNPTDYKIVFNYESPFKPYE